MTRTCYYISVVKYLGNVNFIYLFYDRNIKYYLDLFDQQKYLAIDNFIPKMQKNNNNFLTWFGKELIILIKQKQLSHDVYKHSINIRNHTIFAIYAKCKYSRNRDYALYIENSQIAIKDNPKFFLEIYKR